MKSPSNPDLEAILEQEAGIGQKTRAVMDELGPKIREQEGRKAKAGEKLVQLRAELEAALADYARAWGQVEADAQKSIEAKALRLQDVEAGRTSMSDYLKHGQDEVRIAAEARAEADLKMAELAGIVRAKGRAVIQAEAEVADVAAELAYLYQAPGIYLVESTKEFLKSMESRVLAIGGGYFGAAKARDEKRAELAEVKGQAVHGNIREWPNLDEKGLRQLRLDPHILDQWLPELDRVIASMAGSPDVVDVVALYSGDAKRERLEFRGREAIGFIKGMTIEELKQ